jgi:two-component system OmpR family sensor kinase
VTVKPVAERHSSRAPARLVLRLYLVMVLAIASVVAVILFGRSRREPAPPPRSVSRYVVETITRHRDDPEKMRAEIERARQLTAFEIALYDAGGTLLGSTSATPPPPVPLAQLPPLAQRSEAIPGGDLVIRLDESGEHAVVSFNRPPSRGSDFRADILMVLVSLGIASLVLGRMIAGPLGRIARAARAFGRGDLEARSGLRRRDELGELSQAFDEMADRLKHLLTSQRELVAAVSHELRTPLSRIKVALDLAAEGDADEARASLRDIAGDLAELEELVNDVLAMARLDAHAGGAAPIVRLRTQPVELAALARKAVARFTAGHPERKVELQAGEGVPVEIDADPNLLRRVLENLLENAHKYSPAEGAIRIELQARDDAAVFTVSDRGHGIAPADLAFVFEPFFRGDRSRTRGTGGVGLGLALAKRVVDAHGGHIQIASQLDVGTTVTFSIPRARAAAAPA